MNEIRTNDFVYLRTVDSTNLYCLREVCTIESGSVVVADTQTAGRGRRGRAWYSPDGLNLYASIILKDPPSRVDFSLLPLINSLAIYECIKHYGTKHTWVKWPNDIYVGNFKIAGILSECTTLRDGVQAVVIGIGVNLNMSRENSHNVDKPATSIFIETNQVVNRDEFLVVLADKFNKICLEARNSGRRCIYQSWKAASRLINRRVKLMVDPRNTVEGRVVDLEADGSILIETDSNIMRRFINGDVSLIVQDLESRYR